MQTGAYEDLGQIIVEEVFKKLQTISSWKQYEICAQTGIEGEAVSQQIRGNMNYLSIFKYTRESGMVVKRKVDCVARFQVFYSLDQIIILFDNF